MEEWKPWLDAAYEEAQLGLREGGLPIGSVLVDASHNIVARGHNLRVQTGQPSRCKGSIHENTIDRS